MKSIAFQTSTIDLPLFNGHHSMVRFDIATLDGLADWMKPVAGAMMRGIEGLSGCAHFTIHGCKLAPGQTLRRGGPHTDGSYDKTVLDWRGGGGNGWKIGENGPAVDSLEHDRLYNSSTGGLILVSNYESCLGWIGEYEGLPGVGGDCSKIALDEPFMLERGKVYYGNNHFIHESIPVRDEVHRVFARITLPENHVFNA